MKRAIFKLKAQEYHRLGGMNESYQKKKKKPFLKSHIFERPHNCHLCCFLPRSQAHSFLIFFRLAINKCTYIYINIINGSINI